jgi:hypothetical protein
MSFVWRSRITNIAKPGVRKAAEEMTRFHEERGPHLGPGENIRDLIEVGRRR